MSKFSGDKKHGTSYLGNLETKLKNYLVPKVPRFIETYHLTYMTLLWCVGVLLFSYIASKNSLVWFSFVSLFIFLQYITDLLDGEVGRRRNTGLVKWGYFMDHFLDFLFGCSIVIGYTFIIPQTIIKIGDIDLTFFIFPIEINYYYLMLYFFGIFIGFMVVSFLSFSATNKFQIAYWGFGPTEMRLLFIIFNTSLVFLPKFTYMYIIPIALIFGSIGLIFLVYKTQKELWKLDMREKRN